MSDDTTTSGTSITGGQDPVYTTSLTSTIGRPPRKTYFAVQLIGLLATMNAAWRIFTLRFFAISATSA